jgi:hypothetical protein
LRHGLSFARRSATRFSPGPFTTGPNPRAPLVGRARSGNAHGISSALRSIPWRRVPAFLRFIPTCRFALRASHKSPADFYGRPVAHVSSFPIRKVFQMRPAFANGATPTDFWVVLPRPSRAGFVVFSRACRMPFQRHVIVCSRARHRARSRTAIRRSLTFRWLPSAHGFFGQLMQWTCARAHSKRVSQSSIEQQRRHPCRRRPFSVFGRFAPSRSERSRSSHSRSWGRASVSERLPV